MQTASVPAMRGVHTFRQRSPAACQGWLLFAPRVARNYRSSMPAKYGSGGAEMKAAGSARVVSPLYTEQKWGEQRTLVAAVPLAAGTEVYRVPRRPEFVRSVPDMHTLQVSAREHLDFAQALPPASLTHHECDPNGDLTITSDAVVFVARRAIQPGEFLSFDYNTTEWLMVAPFECQCGSDACVGTVGGFKVLPSERRAAIAPRCSAVVRELASLEGMWPRGSPVDIEMGASRGEPSVPISMEIVDLPADPRVRRQVAGWLIAEWPHLFPDDTEEWYLDEWARGDANGTAVPPHCVVAVDGGEIVGTASVLIDDDLPGATEPGPWLAAVYVLPSHRGKGAGRALVESVSARVKGGLWLYTEHEEEWYESMGWTRVRESEMNGHRVTVMTRCD